MAGLLPAIHVLERDGWFPALFAWSAARDCASES
jgi:hypothetical protein